MKNAVIKLVIVVISITLLNCSSSKKDNVRTPEIDSFSMTLEEVVAEMKPYEGPNSKEQIETNTVLGKVMCGYQGWFRSPGDGSSQGWVHWGGRGGFAPDTCSIDYWPDTQELTKEEKYPTSFKHADGSTAYVYSSFDKKPVVRHFEWMKEAGIHGVFLQRFINGTASPKGLYGYTKVLENVREGANTYGRSWALMYDMSGAKNAERATRLFKADWMRLVDNMKLGNDPNDKAYQHHNGKPLVAIWGLFENREGMPEFYNEIIDFVKNDPVYGGFSVMIGIENHWREGTGEEYEILREAVKKADIISPWTVGRYGSPEVAERFIKEMHAPDIEWCKEHDIDFLPVIFPGFSWHNLKQNSPLDQIPRLQGQFFWRQVYENLQVDAKMFYVAMFDEVDEGTAIFKVHQDPPVGNSPFLNYNGLPEDHYMWLAGKAQEALQNKFVAEKTQPERPGVTLDEGNISNSAFSNALEKLNTKVYNWDKLSAEKTKNGEKRKIFKGFTNELSYFEVHVTTLNPGVAAHGSTMRPDIEELIIVKEGKVLHSINGKEKLLGPGSVILASPGDDHKISNGGNTPAVYFILRWKIDASADMERSKLAGGSMFYDWSEIEFRTTDKGGVRRIMRRPTALLSELEMHVTTLNEGTPSHAEHVHDAEEIILVIKGEVEESINGIPYKAGPGSLILLMNNDSHGIRNIGKGQCEYFAFKWDI